MEEDKRLNTGSDGALKILVAGAGTMGHGLALVMARAGHEIVLTDVDQGVLSRALGLIEGHLKMFIEMERMEAKDLPRVIARIRATTGLDELEGKDLVLESISEDRDIKRDFYREAADRCSPGTIVASNTSYLNIFELAPESLQERLLISHFFAPPYLIPLVEIVKGPGTSHDAALKVRGILQKAGQKPVILEKFIAGFIVNRLQRAMGREIFHLIDEGYAKPEEIDRAVLASLGIRIPVLGVVRRYDFGGLDFAAKVLSNPSIELVNEDKPSRALNDLVGKGKLGVKTCQGFYDYRGENLQQLYHKRDRLLLRMRDVLNEIEESMWKVSDKSG
ncbi:MAG: 3-hydroxyacyl-CoA dehydrogenase family protein [Desulfobacteraceae bacterium]|nr:MAG: 3-hydroxyacyl-CoA dehydrogenase family protein [Desulfobacteraceae bacterium]